MIEKDTYKTLSSPTEEILFKEKKSKFFGYAFPITSEEEVKPHLESLKKVHLKAVHFCYAFQIGTETIYYRANDDGEPNNSAGLPIYGQIQSFDITNVLIVIVRYFGGIKLGVGGLISAYKTAAQLTLENAEIIEKIIPILYQLNFTYKNLSKVMQVIKENNFKIENQKLEDSCEIIISIRKNKSENIASIFENLYEIAWKKI